MIHIIIKNKKNGFVILFAVTLSAILLSIAMGVTNIALKELKFSTSAKETNNAFFAADTGVEYVLYNDKSTSSLYVLTPPATTNTWSNIIIPATCSVGQATCPCAIVSIKKDSINIPNSVITSKGYNIGNSGTCVSSNPNRIEREIKVSY